MPVMAADAAAERAIREAAAAYAAAFNEGDLDAVAAQWAEQAELLEADTRFSGRDAIMAAIASGLDRAPGMTMGIEVDDVIFISPSLARVDGSLQVQFGKEEPGRRSRFTSLRVLEGDAWLLAESTVTPRYDDAIETVAWLVGTWSGESPLGLPVSLSSKLGLDGHVLISELTIQAAGPEGATVFQAMDTVHADRQTGELRCWSFDSTGARAEGSVASDGVRLNRSLTGISPAGSAGGQSRWVQVITPLDDNRIAIQSIERSIDGQPLPDTDVLILTRGNTIRNNFYGGGWYGGRGWYGAHFNAWWPGRWYGGWDGWGVGLATGLLWADLATWGGYGAAPVSYDYGTTVVYSDDAVSVAGEEAGTPEEYAQQATDLAESGAADGVAGDEDEWRPLGVYALARDGETKPSTFISLAVNQQGVLRGNYYDAISDSSMEITGKVDQ